MIDEAVGKGSSARSSIVVPLAEVLDVDAEHAVEPCVDRLHARVQLGEELGGLGGKRGCRRRRGADEGGGERPGGGGAQGCFHALSYLTTPVGPITSPRTSRRYAVSTAEW